MSGNKDTDRSADLSEFADLAEQAAPSPSSEAGDVDDRDADQAEVDQAEADQVVGSEVLTGEVVAGEAVAGEGVDLQADAADQRGLEAPPPDSGSDDTAPSGLAAVDDRAAEASSSKKTAAKKTSATKKTPAKKAASKKATAKKTAAKKTAAKKKTAATKTAAKKTAAKKTAAKKSATKKSAAKKSAAKKSATKKSANKKSPATKTTSGAKRAATKTKAAKTKAATKKATKKKAAAKKAASRTTAARKSVKKAVSKTTAAKTSAKKTGGKKASAKKSTAKKSTAKKSTAKRSTGKRSATKKSDAPTRQQSAAGSASDLQPPQVGLSPSSSPVPGVPPPADIGAPRAGDSVVPTSPIAASTTTPPHSQPSPQRRRRAAGGEHPEPTDPTPVEGVRLRSGESPAAELQRERGASAAPGQRAGGAIPPPPIESRDPAPTERAPDRRPPASQPPVGEPALRQRSGMQALGGQAAGDQHLGSQGAEQSAGSRGPSEEHGAELTEEHEALARLRMLETFLAPPSQSEHDRTSPDPAALDSPPAVPYRGSDSTKAHRSAIGSAESSPPGSPLDAQQGALSRLSQFEERYAAAAGGDRAAGEDRAAGDDQSVPDIDFDEGDDTTALGRLLLLGAPLDGADATGEAGSADDDKTTDLNRGGSVKRTTIARAASETAADDRVAPAVADEPATDDPDVRANVRPNARPNVRPTVRPTVRDDGGDHQHGDAGEIEVGEETAEAAGGTQVAVAHGANGPDGVESVAGAAGVESRRGGADQTEPATDIEVGLVTAEVPIVEASSRRFWRKDRSAHEEYSIDVGPAPMDPGLVLNEESTDPKLSAESDGLSQELDLAQGGDPPEFLPPPLDERRDAEGRGGMDQLAASIAAEVTRFADSRAFGEGGIPQPPVDDTPSAGLEAAVLDDTTTPMERPAMGLQAPEYADQDGYVEDLQVSESGDDDDDVDDEYLDGGYEDDWYAEPTVDDDGYVYELREDDDYTVRSVDTNPDVDQEAFEVPLAPDHLVPDELAPDHLVPDELVPDELVAVEDENHARAERHGIGDGTIIEERVDAERIDEVGDDELEAEFAAAARTATSPEDTQADTPESVLQQEVEAAERVPRRRLGYQPGLDGLRAFSVIAVILYHAGFEWMAGGFLGVEVFFVVSGFLITVLLIEEYEKNGRISLKRFWVRRARRLLPALFAMLAVVSMGVLAFGDRAQQSDLRRNLPWSIFYAANWGQIVGDESYFATGSPPLLRHLWSLAVEEQWYIVWPLLFLVLARGRRYGLAARLVLVLVAGVMGLMWWVQNDSTIPDPTNFNYLSTITRSGGLLLGAAGAFVWRPWRRARSVFADARRLDFVFILALFGLGCSFVIAHIDNSLMYPWGLTAVSFLSLVCVLLTVHPAARAPKGLLDLPLMVGLGKRSYGLYLWHWPIFVVLEATTGSWSRFGLAILITIPISELCYQWIEQPIRTRAYAGTWLGSKPVGALVGVAAIAVVAVGVIGYSRVEPFDAAEGEQTAQFSLSTTIPTTTPQTTTAASNAAVSPVGPVTTAPPPPEPMKLLLVGDSQAHSLVANLPDGLETVADVSDGSVDGCSVYDNGRLRSTQGFELEMDNCEGWSDKWASAADEHQPDVALVVLGAWDPLDIVTYDAWLRFGTEPRDAAFVEGVNRGLDAMSGAAKQLAVLEVPCMRPIPADGAFTPPLPERRDDTRIARLNDLLRQVATARSDTVFVEGPPEWCTDPAIAENPEYRWDGVHVYQKGANLVFEKIIPALRELNEANANAAEGAPSTSTAGGPTSSTPPDGTSVASSTTAAG